VFIELRHQFLNFYELYFMSFYSCSKDLFAAAASQRKEEPRSNEKPKVAPSPTSTHGSSDGKPKSPAASTKAVRDNRARMEKKAQVKNLSL
jgi:hypothetical protein